MANLLDSIRSRLVVSCQPVSGGPLDHPEIVAAFALAALAGGAAGLRIEGVANLRAVRAVTAAPVIGLIKRDLEGTDVRITPLLEDVKALAAAGADAIAFDATDRPRPVSVGHLVNCVRAHGLLAMADCSNANEGEGAHNCGAAILGTTLSGYAGGPVPDEPDLALVAALKATGAFVVAEGRYNAPIQAAAARRKGADAVVVGSAITRPEVVTGWFAKAIAEAAGSAGP